MSEFTFDREKMELPVTRDEIWSLFLAQTAVNLEIIRIVTKLSENVKADGIVADLGSLMEKVVSLIEERNALVKIPSKDDDEG